MIDMAIKDMGSTYSIGTWFELRDIPNSDIYGYPLFSSLDSSGALGLYVGMTANEIRIKHENALFHVSCRTVSSATRQSISYWAGELVAAPSPRPKANFTAPAISKAPVITTINQSSRPGSRIDAILVEPEKTIDIPEDPTVEASER